MMPMNKKIPVTGLALKRRASAGERGSAKSIPRKHKGRKQNGAQKVMGLLSTESGQRQRPMEGPWGPDNEVFSLGNRKN